MPKHSSTQQEDHQELASDVLYPVVPDAGEDASGKPDDTEPKKNPAAVALGRLGGLKGGKVRAIKLTAEQRSAIAKKAAAKRWGNDAIRKDGQSSSGGASG